MRVRGGVVAVVMAWAGACAGAAALACRTPPAEKPWIEEDAWTRSEGGTATRTATGSGTAPVTGSGPAAATRSRTATGSGTATGTAPATGSGPEAGPGSGSGSSSGNVEGAGTGAGRATIDGSLVAVLLPLSGPRASIGSELRLAIEAAPVGGARRVFLDTRGEEVGAAAAVDAAAGQGALAILGPVGVKESAAASARATALGLPIATLSPADVPAAEPGAAVFRLAESPAGEARAAAAIAAELGAPTVGVFVPDDDVGRAAGDAFAAAAVALGLEVTARGVYDPAAPDLLPAIKTFLGLDPTINPRLAAHLRRHGRRGWQSFSPDVPFALLYLPDRHDRAALVASYLPYLGVELRTAEFLDPEYLRRKHGGRIPQVVQLLGSSAWHHPSLVARGGDAVEGAYFVEPCPGALGDVAAEPLFARFAARAGRPPSTAAQQAHDAWLLVERARARATATPVVTIAGGPRRGPRAAFAAALRGARLEDGACTPATVGADGLLVREPALLGVDAGEIVAVPY
jgi:ABC-type branched-subunit amino acid transport system substrate-binding protein